MIYYFKAFFRSLFNKLPRVRFFLAFMVLLLSCTSSSKLVNSDKPLKKYSLLYESFSQKNIHIKKYARKDVLKALKESIQEDYFIRALYEKEETHNYVVNFFISFTNSESAAMSILYNSYLHNVPISLSFALAWTESNFKRVAVNQNLSSVDRGLFQLNNKTFTNLRLEDFFDLDINTRNGVLFLKTCINLARKFGKNSLRMALYMYNAGPYIVTKGIIPKSTLIYAKKILSRKNYIERRLYNYIIQNSFDKV